MKNLPEEIILHILEYSLTCKKQQDFYVNKFLTSKIIKSKKCKPVKCLGKLICAECHKDAIKFLSYLQYSSAV